MSVIHNVVYRKMIEIKRALDDRENCPSMTQIDKGDCFFGVHMDKGDN